MITVYGVEIDERRISEITILPFRVRITVIDDRGAKRDFSLPAPSLRDIITLLEALEGCKE